MFARIIGTNLVEVGEEGFFTQLSATQPANLLYHYKCDDTDTPLVDSQAAGESIVESGSPSYGTTGQVGDAVSTSTGGHFRDQTFVGADFFTGDWTICVGVRQTGAASCRIVTVASAGFEQIYHLGFSSTTAFHVRVRNQGVDDFNANVTSSPSVDLDRWYFLTLRRTSDDYDFFHDGTKLAVVAGAGAPGAQALSQFAIGARVTAALPLTGDVQHVLIWNNDLTDSEVSDLATKFLA